MATCSIRAWALASRVPSVICQSPALPRPLRFALHQHGINIDGVHLSLGSARINADGSFTSQETSFDSISNAASGSFSRASSTSEEAFFQDLGSLGLASSLRMNKQKKKLRNIDRKEICDYSIANPLVKQDAIANRFGIERSTVSKILKHKEKWLAIDPQSDAARIAKHRAVKFPAVEDRLTSWVAALKASGKPVRDSIIRQEALRIARELGLGEDKFKASAAGSRSSESAT